jgi:DNA-binding CsgD family transcriptional regulator
VFRVLVGRAAERQALDRLLDDARAGRSAVLGLVGEPGIGKTALLDDIVARATGMNVLAARGVESEAAVPFAGLAELLRPALHALDHIPAPQAAALAGSLALGPAVSQDRFAIGAATLSLLAAHAEQHPLLVAVDDAHQLDGPSAAALLFAARRLVADPIAVVFAVREGEPSLLDGSDLPVLRLGGLDEDAAAQLLPRAGGRAVRRMHEATGGNPLALLELAAEVAELPPVDAPVPLPTRIAAAFLRRYDELDGPARQLLQLVAAADVRDVGVLTRAAGDLGTAIGALAPAEEAGLVDITDGRVEFRHPLVRSAVYQQASPAQRRAAHAALARALPDRDADRRAWHLAAAAIGPDDRASSALAQAARRAQERSAYGVALADFERAARLATEPAAAARLLVEAVSCAALDGQWQRAATLLDEVDALPADAPAAARADQMRAQIVLHRGPVMASYPLFVRAAETVASEDAETAVGLLADAAHAALYAGDADAMSAAAERAADLARTAGTAQAEMFVSMARGMALVLAGDGEQGADAVRRGVEILEATGAAGELPDDPRMLLWAALGPLWIRQTGLGRGLAARAVRAVRQRSAIGTLPYLLNPIARDQVTTDQWAAGEASYDEAVRLARETGQRAELGSLLAGWAWLEGRQGRAEQCRAHAAEAAQLCAELGMVFYGIWTVQALGYLELGLGRPVPAAQQFERQRAVMREHGIVDADLSPVPELVEAYLRAGREAEAGALSEEYVAAAGAKAQPWALARAYRCRGMLAAARDAAAEFDRALALHARTPDVFETARTRLAYGTRLRRLRRRLDSREQLRAALATFLRLGAAGWAEQASAELAATGETARRRDVTTLLQLTPQEFQIARLLADGSTTREAAAATFLSPKTIEYHLRSVYRKLGVRSRQDLAQAMSTDG